MDQQHAAGAVPDQQGPLTDQQIHPAPQPIRAAEVPALGHGDATLETGRASRTPASRQVKESSRVGETVDPWTAVFYTPGEFTGMRSVVYNELALTVDSNSKAERYTIAAVEGAQTSLQAGAPHRPARSVLFDRTTLATGAFRLNHLPTAIDSTVHALQMAEAVRSARAVDRLVRMTEAAEPWRGGCRCTESMSVWPTDTVRAGYSSPVTPQISIHPPEGRG
jgi:hypothetical protein